MLDLKTATNVVIKNLPNGTIQCSVEYKDMYLFQVFGDDPGEEEVDPFYSVNKETGEFKEFSILTDGDIGEVVSLFKNVTRR